MSSDCSYDEHGVFPVEHLEQQVTGRCEYEAADTGATDRDASSKRAPLVEVVADRDDRWQEHETQTNTYTRPTSSLKLYTVHIVHLVHGRSTWKNWFQTIICMEFQAGSTVK